MNDFEKKTEEMRNEPYSLKGLLKLRELLDSVAYDDDDPYDYACEHGVWVDSETYIPFDGEGFMAQQRFNGGTLIIDSSEDKGDDLSEIF